MSDRGVTVFIGGAPRMFATSHPSFNAIRDAIESGDSEAVERLVDKKQNISTTTNGRVQILDNTILLSGEEVSGRLVDRILEMVVRGSQALDGYMKFLDNLYDNPSKTSIDELYLFIEACDLPITEDGHFLAYKRVRNDYRDIYTSTIDNSVGTSPTMTRRDVDDRRDRTCSAGLHFCAYSYLDKFGIGPGDNVMVVKINPANVVSIPSDYNNAKGRTWTYDVVGEIKDWAHNKITPWYTDEYSSDEEMEPEFDEEMEPDYDEEMEPDYDTDDNEDDDIFAIPNMDNENSVMMVGNMLATIGFDYDTLDECIKYHVKQGNINRGVVTQLGPDEIRYDIQGDYLALGGYAYATRIPEVKPVAVKGNGKGKLSINQVRRIKNEFLPLYTKGQTTLTAIGKEFGVHRETIARIDRGQIWADVT
jgi:hypothetical protein